MTAQPWRFVPITREDYPLVAHWLHQPEVARWWCDSPEPGSLEAEYGGVIDGTEAAEVFIAHHGAQPLGLVQRFALSAYPEYEADIARWTDVPQGAWSIDYFIGEAAQLRRGLGTLLLRELTAGVWARAPQAPAIVVPVHADNRASCRVLERNGYRHVADARMEPDNPTDSQAHRVYRIDRPLRPAAG